MRNGTDCVFFYPSLCVNLVVDVALERLIYSSSKPFAHELDLSFNHNEVS